MTSREAARLIGVERSTITLWIRTGLHFFPSAKLNKSRVWVLDDGAVRRWFFKMTHPPRAKAQKAHVKGFE